MNYNLLIQTYKVNDESLISVQFSNETQFVCTFLFFCLRQIDMFKNAIKKSRLVTHQLVLTDRTHAHAPKKHITKTINDKLEQ